MPILRLCKEKTNRREEEYEEMYNNLGLSQKFLTSIQTVSKCKYMIKYGKLSLNFYINRHVL